MYSKQSSRATADSTDNIKGDDDAGINVKKSKKIGKTSRSGIKAARSRSQTVSSVRHVDLKVAIGRTMSLQPTQQEMGGTAANDGLPKRPR